MYKRRVKMFIALAALMGAVLVGRLFHLQIVSGDQYIAQAQDLLRNTRLEPAIRGRILDRAGRVLAMDEPCYDLCLHYKLINGDERWSAQQARLIARQQGISRDEARAIFDRRRSRALALAREIASMVGQDYDQRVERLMSNVERTASRVGMEVVEQTQYHPVVPGLDESVEAFVRMQMEETVGLEVRPSLRRWYPYKEAACHVIGVTGQVSVQDIEEHNLSRQQEPDALARDLVNYLPGDVIGRSGIEKMCEDVLRGRRGYRLFRNGQVIEDQPAQPGGDVHLTLDMELQRRLMKVWHDFAPSNGDDGRPPSTGAIVVLGVETGEVLAMLSTPSYDLNNYLRLYPDMVRDDRDFPLMHRATMGQYQPGSTIKPLSALAALGSGHFGPHTTVQCDGVLAGAARPNVCWIWQYRVGHGPVDVVGALLNSCNIYFYVAANRIGMETLAQTFRSFGLGERSGIGLYEQGGSVPQGRQSSAEARNCAIGQGGMLATPLQVANQMAAIARGGTWMSPLIALEGGPGRQRRDGLAPAEHIGLVHEGMRRVVHDSVRGTAYKIFHGRGIEPLGFQVCGKTGTAQTSPQRRDSDGDGRITLNDEIIREGDHAWFAGFAPYGNPKVAIAVLVEYGGGGGANAGPIAREALRVCKEMGYIE